jgi:glutathione S-transferase
MLELYHYGPSVCAAKVRFALAEKQLTWASHYVDVLKGEQLKPEFLALNPNAVVPVLIDRGIVITESTVICEYVEEAFPDHPIYPLTPRFRAHVRVWTKAVDEQLHPACSAIAQGLTAAGAADGLHICDSYLRKMEQALGHADWLVGGKFSMADIAMTPYVNRLNALAMEGLWRNRRLPHVESWFDRIRARPSFASALLAWTPPELDVEMRARGEQAWPQVRALLGVS